MVHFWRVTMAIFTVLAFLADVVKHDVHLATFALGWAILAAVLSKGE